MTPEELYDELEKFDWYYEMSDDHRVYKRGHQEYHRLLAASDESEENKTLFRDYMKHMYTGRPWGNEQAPKPKRPSHVD